ncbi:Na(+)/H(+) antiporter subunit D [Natrinema hispanicum]|uniref:Multisubunit sodium/proton antiporter, MrpD subunit n=1 Tax=Natrinema hispanicum TaxID=392421 RepID=A0A1I0J3J0_9EURY|nr:Na(+)/H(+) antiporter subunit D [Natrinema hispanicum]SEU04339.1 multisubunit sodium/proton antiporter, MrpD subunit [Natrinema hispanicum]
MELELLSLAYPPLLVFVAALLVLALPRIAGFTMGALSLAAVLAISLVAPGGEHLGGTFLGFEVVPYYVDDFSRMVGLGLGFLGVCSVIYAYSSEASKTLVALALVYVASSVGAAFAGDWLVLLFMWELMAVTSTLVVWHYGGEAVRAGFRYALFHGTGGVLVMLAIAAHYVQTGTFIYTETGIATGIPALLAVLGMGVNVAFIGVHTWLPDTYPRPHIAASVFLSVYTTKTSAFILYRAFPIGSESDLAIYVAYMGGLMAVYGATFALLQHDMRALLSYHIQAQLGYIVAGIGMGAAMSSEIAVAGALSHLFNNILFKSLLFMAVGVVIYRTDEEDLYKLGGLWREMPLTAIGFGLGALSITAIPGFNGYVSKGMLFDAANPDPHYYGQPEYQALYWLLWLGAIGTLLSFIKLGYYVFFHGESEFEVADAKLGQTVAMFGLGGACLLFGVWWEGLADLAPTLHAHGGHFTFAYPGGEGTLHPYSPSHLETAGILTGVAAVTFAVVRKPLSKLDLGDPAMVVYPVTYYGSRWTMLAVTETYAAVDAAVVGAVKRCYWAGNNPVLAVEAAARRLPLVEVDERQPTDGGRPSTIHLRASIGTTVLLLTLVLTVVLWLLVV